MMRCNSVFVTPQGLSTLISVIILTILSAAISANWVRVVDSKDVALWSATICLPCFEYFTSKSGNITGYRKALYCTFLSVAALAGVYIAVSMQLVRVVGHGSSSRIIGVANHQNYVQDASSTRLVKVYLGLGLVILLKCEFPVSPSFNRLFETTSNETQFNYHTVRL